MARAEGVEGYLVPRQVEPHEPDSDFIFSMMRSSSEA